MAGAIRHRQPELQRRQPRQARHRARPEERRRRRTAFRRLARRADILIENYRPGVMRRFGLDYDALSRRQSRADLRVDLRLRPDRTRPRQGRVRSGRAGRVRPDVDYRRAGRPPVKVGRAADRSRRRAVRACRRSSRRCIYRTRTGRGQYIDTSLVEAGVALSVWEATEYFSRRAACPQPMGSAHRMSAPYQAIRCADGYITLAAANDRLFGRLCELLNRPEWSSDPDLRRRYRARPEQVDAGCRDRDRHAGTAAAATGSSSSSQRDSVRADQQLRSGVRRSADRARAAWSVDVEHPTLGRIRTLGSPIKMSATPPIVGRRAPLLGEQPGKCCARPGSATRRSHSSRTPARTRT